MRSSPNISGMPWASSTSSTPPSVPHSSRPLSNGSSASSSPRPSTSLSPPASIERGFTPFDQMIHGGTGSSTIGNASTGLEVLKSVLEAVDTLPLVKYLASVGIQLLQYVIEQQITNDMFKSLTYRAKDIVVAVARSCHGMQSVAVQLEDDLRQLTGTMDSILAYATERISRRTYKKLLSKSEDVAAVKALNEQLTHAFHIFEIQSSVSTRLVQQQMMQQLHTMSVSPTPPRPEFIANCNLRVQEGIYMIKSVADGQVIETVDHKPLGGDAQHTYMAPSLDGKLQTQLWSIQKKANNDFEFVIRSMATGTVLDVHHGSNQSGSKVCCHAWNAGNHQTWSFWGTRQSLTEEYCTIRSAGGPIVLDGYCPRDRSECDELHATAVCAPGPTASQEWHLIRLSSTTSTSLNTVIPDVVYPRRPLLLQNVLTGMLATRAKNANGPNVVFTSSPSQTSFWSFVYTENHGGGARTDCFAIESSTPNRSTIDHWAGMHINIFRFDPTNPHHTWAPVARDGFFIFRNVATGNLLAASRSQQGYVDTLPDIEREDPACHWRLLDATTREHVRVLYDSALTIMPPELAGQATAAPQQTPVPLELRTGVASQEIRVAMLDSFAQEHDTIRAMLLEGCKALIVAPRMIAGWKNGRVKRVAIQASDDEDFKYRPHDAFDPCEHS
ncbi:hypothetical protein PENSPDRAFT_753385 [Peniophora sp. CONT]|nr:hypothetical protein PENSPDRAFT_753385 [Peniophora sp. CONT]